MSLIRTIRRITRQAMRRQSFAEWVATQTSVEVVYSSEQVYAGTWTNETYALDRHERLWRYNGVQWVSAGRVQSTYGVLQQSGPLRVLPPMPQRFGHSLV